MKEPLLLEGVAYSRSSLLDFCRKQLGDSSVPQWRREVLAFIALFLDSEDRAIMQRSSGSTGDPKSIRLSKDAMLKSAETTLKFFNLKPGDKVLLALPVHYIAGKMMVVRALLGGLDLLLREPSSRPLRDIPESIAFTAMVPLQIEESLRTEDPLEGISKILIGGGELHPSTRDRLSAMSVPEIFESFGMTETYTHFAIRRMNGPQPDAFFRILEGVRIGLDHRGCLEVDIDGVTDATVRTNDLVEINQEGDGFVWQGRFDNLINTGGIKIIPELLEEQVKESLELECLVLAEADRKLGNSLVLVVEYQGSNPPLNKWMGMLRKRLSRYEMPRRILTTPSIPRNASMKPDRTSARQLLLK